MLKFAYQGQPGPGGNRDGQQGPSVPVDKSSTHSHSGEGEDDSCCEVCDHRKRELSREKTRVNRARSRSRERIPRYVSSSDTSTAFSEESRSRTDTSSEDTSSLGCQHDDRGRKISRPDLTQCEVDVTGVRENTENEQKSSNGKKGFNLFKMFQKARMKEKKVTRQCPVCGNDESENCCISNGTDMQQGWLDSTTRKLRSRGKTSPKGKSNKSDNEDFINAWRYNDGSFSSCETSSCYNISPSNHSRHRYRNNGSFESDSECMVRRRKMHRTKSGSELCNLERNNNEVAQRVRSFSRSCEKLQSPSKVSPQRKEGLVAQYSVPVVLREETSATDKLQKRYRKKNRRSKSCEKLNITNSPQKQSYRNYDSDWEVRSTVQTAASSQDPTSKQRRKARSCERLSVNQFETDDALRHKDHEAKRKNLEQKLTDIVNTSALASETTLVSRTPTRHTIKEATVKKTKTMRSRYSPSEEGAGGRHSTTIPRQRSFQSDNEIAINEKSLPKQHSYEFNLNQNAYTGSDVVSNSRYPKYSVPSQSFKKTRSTQSLYTGTKGQEQNPYNSLPHKTTRRFQQNDDDTNYSAQLRQVASAQSQLFSTSNRYGSDGLRPCGTAASKERFETTSRFKKFNAMTDSRLKENLLDYALPEDTCVDGEMGYPSSNEDTQSLLETSIDSNTVGIGKQRYTSLTSLSTTVSTTSEDSMDSGNGSISDRTIGNPPTLTRYSPIEAERQRRCSNVIRPPRPLVPQRSTHETSDYESETSSTDPNSARGRRGSSQLDQNSPAASRTNSPSPEVYRPPRIRYIF